jgi:hypothetical protein
VVVKPDVLPEDIEKGLDSLVVIGQLLCPEPLAGLLQAKTSQVVGESRSYPASGRTITGKAVLDDSFLNQLEDGSDLVVLGSLGLPQVVSNDLLAQKLGKLHVVGSIRLHEENAGIIRARLSNGSGKMTVIPAGFTLVDKPLFLDDTMLQALPASKLYCRERVVVDGSTTAEELDDSLERIVARDLLLCPAELKGVMTKKCDMLATQVIFYEGQLWLVDGAEELIAPRFEYLDGKATLVVTGALTIEAGVEPRMLAERLVKVHNQGVIECTPEQKGAIQARLGLNEGVLGESEGQEEAPEGGPRLGNANHLEL